MAPVNKVCRCLSRRVKVWTKVLGDTVHELLECALQEPADTTGVARSFGSELMVICPQGPVVRPTMETRIFSERLCWIVGRGVFQHVHSW